MKKMKLPEAVQTFQRIREKGFYYVDKTPFISLLMQEENNNIFLSRPRRFGKSLFVSTLKEAFEGNRELFEGLDIYDRWDWSTKHPVVHLDFSAGDYMSTEDIQEAMNLALGRIEDSTGLTTKSRKPAFRLDELIGKLHKLTGEGVVLLVDEYDKPILDAIEEPKVAVANRNTLRGIYGVTKRAAEHIHFSFFTGVSRFAKTSLFSGGNNLNDITIDPVYSAICGYTESNLDEVFAPEIEGLKREKIREWYNGYSWLGQEKVYNPYDILYLFKKRKYRSWWFKTGIPKYLIETLKKNDVVSVDLDRPLAHSDLLESFDVDNIAPKTLLFQTGYLTIAEEIIDVDEDMEDDEHWDEDEERDEDEGDVSYRLDYPNREVRQNLNRLLLDILLPGASETISKERRKLVKNLASCNTLELITQLQGVFACLPKQWHAPVDLTKYEAYFASSLYSYLMGAGLMVRAEEATDKGRIDLVVEGSSYVYIVEIKMVTDEKQGEAVKQILNKQYQQKYRGTGKRIYLMGIEISKKTHNIVRLDIADPDATVKGNSREGGPYRNLTGTERLLQSPYRAHDRGWGDGPQTRP